MQHYGFIFGYELYFYIIHNIKENLFKNFISVLSENFLVKSQNIIGAIDLSIYKYVSEFIKIVCKLTPATLRKFYFEIRIIFDK